MPLEIDISEKNGVAVAALTGAVDGNTAPEAQTKVIPLLESHKTLVVDMSRVNYMSSAGLRMMLLLYRQAAARSASIILAGLDDQIRDTMSITGFLAFFTVCETVDEALKAAGGMR